MVKVSSFEIEGLVLIFRSSDHLPPHFHVRKGNQWEIRVVIETSTFANGLDYSYKFPKNRSRKFRGLSTKEEAEILRCVILHKELLLLEWQEKVNTGELI
jgi:hypothetical protein